MHREQFECCFPIETNCVITSYSIHYTKLYECIIKDFPKLSAPAYLYALLDQSLTQRPYDVVKRASEVTIECENELIGHADGEPITLGNKAIIKIQPLSLNVIIPPVDFNKNQIIEDLKEILPPLPLLPKLPIENKLKEDTKIRKPQS